MSYSLDLSFKNCKKKDIYKVLENYTNLLLDNAEDIIKDNIYYLQWDKEKSLFENKKIIYDFIKNIFSRHIWYCDKIKSLCIVNNNDIENINKYFDGYIYFQDSCDHSDYEFNEWNFNKVFRKIVKKYKKLTKKEIQKILIKEDYPKDILDSLTDEDICYHKKELIYDECYSLIAPIWEKGFEIKFIDQALDENLIKLKDMTIKILKEEDEDFNIYYKNIYG